MSNNPTDIRARPGDGDEPPPAYRALGSSASQIRIFRQENNQQKWFKIVQDKSEIRFFEEITADEEPRESSCVPACYKHRTFCCDDGSVFFFHRDGTGYYSDGQGNCELIPEGKYGWCPGVKTGAA